MKFEGIMPALVTPLNKDETINVKVLKELIDYQLDLGADGFYVGGATGEGLAISTEQRMILAEESVKAINGRKPCIFQVAAADFHDAVALAKYAEKVGAEFVDIEAGHTHAFTNECDAECNVCGFIRPVSHFYTSACDKDCNVCGEFRKALHLYSGACDETCNLCENERDAAEHSYSSESDTECNVCGALRRVASDKHTYSNSCDIDCNVCKSIRKVNHTYTDVCDAECNICYGTRKAPHKYDGACDGECNLCGKTRTVPNHTYGDDLVCDECGYNNLPVGDIDGTGEVDLTDVTFIAKSLAGWEVDCNESALDVNVDGAVNLKDLIHLARYVAGWEGYVLH